MAEATFQPSTLYGLDPLSLAQKTANIGATVAQTQATKQSMVERAQMMRLREEEQQRARAQYEQQQWQQQQIRPAIEAKAKADVAEYQSKIKSFEQVQNANRMWAEDQNGIRAAAMWIAGLKDDEEKIKQWQKFIPQISYLNMLPNSEGKAFLDTVTDQYKGTVNEHMFNKKVEQALSQTKMQQHGATQRTEMRVQQDKVEALQKKQEEWRKTRMNFLQNKMALRTKDIDARTGTNDEDKAFATEQRGLNQKDMDEIESLMKAEQAQIWLEANPNHPKAESIRAALSGMGM